MCRLFGFRTATDTSVNHSLVEAENALAKQSRFHQDGWGIAYYIGGFPHLIRSEKQALTDKLFGDVGMVVTTQTFVAHIRNATLVEPHVLNCHPFQFGRWIFAHNGEIAGYSLDEVKQRVLAHVDEHHRRHIMGSTDSEAIFHVFLSRLAARRENIQSDDVVADDVVGAIGETVDLIREAAPDEYTDPDDGSEHVTRLNFMVTNGNLLVGLRYGRALFYSTYKTRCPDRDTCESFVERQCEREVLFGQVKHLIVASEPISTEVNVWHELEDGECVYVDRNMFIRWVRLLSGGVMPPPSPDDSPGETSGPPGP